MKSYFLNTKCCILSQQKSFSLFTLSSLANCNFYVKNKLKSEIFNNKKY